MENVTVCDMRQCVCLDAEKLHAEKENVSCRSEFCLSLLFTLVSFLPISVCSSLMYHVFYSITYFFPLMACITIDSLISFIYFIIHYSFSWYISHIPEWYSHQYPPHQYPPHISSTHILHTYPAPYTNPLF